MSEGNQGSGSSVSGTPLEQGLMGRSRGEIFADLVQRVGQSLCIFVPFYNVNGSELLDFCNKTPFATNY